MERYKVSGTDLSIPKIGLGCMRITGLKEVAKVRELIDTAMEAGINFFDHADIYAGGESEQIFGEAVKQGTLLARENMIIQTKCAIRPGMFDFSKEHILGSVDKSLKRLGMDYVDILLLHRPDTLMEPEEVAEAFDKLAASGKVRYFGVSNENGAQIALLNKYCDNKVRFNQMQLSVAYCPMIDAGFNVNMENDAGVNRDGQILEYCRYHDITLQAWSPFQYGFFGGVFVGSEKYPELNEKLDALAAKYKVSASAIAIAWILRHPAGIQPILGTTNAKRVREIAKAADIRLERKEWYDLYLAAGKKLP